MKISEKQVFLMIRILQAVLQMSKDPHESEVINDFLNEIHAQQSEELREIE